jgi:hypothetical protein
MSYRVVRIRDNKLIEVPDGMPVPNGCRIAVDAMFADGLTATQRAVFADSQDEDDEVEDGAYDATLSDDERKAVLYGPARRLSDAEAAEERRAAAYASFKDKLNTANKPNWRYSKEKPRTAGPWTSPAPSRVPQRRDGPPAGLNDKAADAYDRRNKWLQDRWKTHRQGSAPAHAPTTVAPAWSSDGNWQPPMIGSFSKGQGRSPYQR